MAARGGAEQGFRDVAEEQPVRARTALVSRLDSNKRRLAATVRIELRWLATAKRGWEVYMLQLGCKVRD
jgi:hypothetical protein